MRPGLTLVLLCAALAADGDPPPEYAVKGAFLAHFGRFVTWPAAAFESDDAPFRIGVVGEDPFGKVLDAIAAKPIQGRRVEISRVKTPRDAKGCHIVFITKSERKRIAAILQELAKLPVLTVGETEGFARAGGVIGFLLVEGKVRFEINPEAARRKKLVLHPKLLRLGTIVEEEGK